MNYQEKRQTRNGLMFNDGTFFRFLGSMATGNREHQSRWIDVILKNFAQNSKLFRLSKPFENDVHPHFNTTPNDGDEEESIHFNMF